MLLHQLSVKNIFPTLIFDENNTIYRILQAFMSGKVKAKGNIMLMQKLTTVLKNANAKAKM